MYLENINDSIITLNDYIWGLPSLLAIIATSVAMTIAFRGIQFRYFIESWKILFEPQAANESTSAEYITPVQAFINALSASLGNGSLAGMATAMYAGGPGAGFWIFVLGFFLMAIRFAEVYASSAFTEKQESGLVRGGPMVYLSKVPGGRFLPAFYAFFCLMLTFVTGNAMQCNSIARGLVQLTNWNLYGIAAGMFLVLLYIMLGGAKRIVRFSDIITPVKVGLFFIATIIVLMYNVGSLWQALVIMTTYAFTPQAIRGALMGYTVQSALRYGISRSINATEVGLGTSGIIFGTATTKQPVRSGILSLATTSISNFGVCFLLMWLLTATGAYQSGHNGIGMTIVAYESVFGVLGGWVVTILSMMFGVGCVIAYAYIGKECWAYLTGGKYFMVYSLIFCSMAVFGALIDVPLLWNAIDTVNAGLIACNLYGLIMLIPQISAAVKTYDARARTPRN